MCARKGRRATVTSDTRGFVRGDAAPPAIREGTSAWPVRALPMAYISPAELTQVEPLGLARAVPSVRTGKE